MNETIRGMKLSRRAIKYWSDYPSWTRGVAHLKMGAGVVVQIKSVSY